MALRSPLRKNARSDTPVVGNAPVSGRHGSPGPSALPAGDGTRPVQGGLSRWQDEPVADGSGERVPFVHKIGALAVAAVIGVFGVLGFVGGLAFFATDGEEILGLSSNGALSTVSVVTAAVLVFAAFRSARTASTIMMVIGGLFLLSAFANLAVLRTELNVLAFEMPNVIFSIVAGLVLLTLGAYGRVSGHLPADSPYATGEGGDEEDHEVFARTPEERAAEAAMREAEVAVVQHVASNEQRRRVAAMAQVHSRGDRRRVWMSFDETGRELR
jgi:hypothetical protein